MRFVVLAVVLAITVLLFGCASSNGKFSEGETGEQSAQVANSGDADSSQTTEDAIETNNDTEGVISVEDAEYQTGIMADGEGSDYAAGEVLVTFADGVAVSDVNELYRSTASIEDADVSEEMIIDGSLSDGVLHGGELGNPAVLVYVSEGCTVVQAIAELQQSSFVVDAQPNYLYEMQ